MQADAIPCLFRRWTFTRTPYSAWVCRWSAAAVRGKVAQTNFYTPKTIGKEKEQAQISGFWCRHTKGHGGKPGIPRSPATSKCSHSWGATEPTSFHISMKGQAVRAKSHTLLSNDHTCTWIFHLKMDHLWEQKAKEINQKKKMMGGMSDAQKRYVNDGITVQSSSAGMERGCGWLCSDDDEENHLRRQKLFLILLSFNNQRIHVERLQPKEVLLDSIRPPVDSSLHCVVSGSDSRHISSSLHWAH